MELGDRQAAHLANKQDRQAKRWIVTIRDGKVIDKLEMFVFAADAEAAEAIGEQLIIVVDSSAYIDGVTEAA